MRLETFAGSWPELSCSFGLSAISVFGKASVGLARHVLLKLLFNLHAC